MISRGRTGIQDANHGVSQNQEELILLLGEKFVLTQHIGTTQHLRLWNSSSGCLNTANNINS